MPDDNVAPMLDELPDDDDDGVEADTSEARVSERDYGTNQEKVEGEAERRADEDDQAPSEASDGEARR